MKLRITVQGVRYDVDVEVLDGADGGVGSATPAALPPSPAAGGGAEVPSPIAGSVFDIRVKPGDTVQVNDTLLVLEAMKMETNIASPQAGTVSEVCVKAGDSVTHGQVLVRFA
jgi:biotin carboxyl carrier protein